MRKIKPTEIKTSVTRYYIVQCSILQRFKKNKQKNNRKFRVQVKRFHFNSSYACGLTQNGKRRNQTEANAKTCFCQFRLEKNPEFHCLSSCSTKHSLVDPLSVNLLHKKMDVIHVNDTH